MVATSRALVEIILNFLFIWTWSLLSLLGKYHPSIGHVLLVDFMHSYMPHVSTISLLETKTLCVVKMSLVSSFSDYKSILTINDRAEPWSHSWDSQHAWFGSSTHPLSILC